LLSTGTRLILISASQYSRRVTETLAGYPFRLLLLIKTPPNEYCELRQTIATEILDTEDSKLDIVPKKVRALFFDDLLIAKQSGKLGWRLAVNLQQVSRTWKADTRENERVPRF